VKEKIKKEAFYQPLFISIPKPPLSAVVIVYVKLEQFFT